MKFLITALFLFAFSVAHAEDTCNARATEKKLAGAAKTSFLKKCEKDARAACEMDDIVKKQVVLLKKPILKNV